MQPAEPDCGIDDSARGGAAMTDTAISEAAPVRLAPALFTLAVFTSAALVFLVEPMIAALMLPRLGGSPAVWNTSLAFFQIALLVGYAYAHLLQRLSSVRRQMIVHLAVLFLAAAVLPLHISRTLGVSSTGHPILWLLGVLALSIGPPFAALSATAPLLQAWFTRTQGGASPYGLYAASNLGSLLALLAYPFVIQPLSGLKLQALAWSIGYAGFAVLIGVLALRAWRVTDVAPTPAPSTGIAGSAVKSIWGQRLRWVLLAAAPSSLLLGVTAHITTDVASAPFLWIPPLAIYLLSFVIAFQDRPPIPPKVWLALQALAAPVCLMIMPIRAEVPLLALHLVAFLTTAMVCHQALAASRPAPARLTEFYLLLSLGGVIGGAFNAFIAPVLFNTVWEYPLVLVLAGLARPWGSGEFSWRHWLFLFIGIICMLLVGFGGPQLNKYMKFALLASAVISTFMLGWRAPAFALMSAILTTAAVGSQAHFQVTEARRSFFGVVQIGFSNTPGIGPMKFMVHGSTLHGAQASSPALRCQPMTYYATRGPIGQVFQTVQAAHPAASLGAVGLGTGTVAAYVRPSDRLQFFEIDPLVVSMAGDPKRFSYWHGCARGPVSVTLGDARLSLTREPDAKYDLLLVDAFSSDSVPIHLLTVEAMRTYLRVIKPGGVVIMHLSNRHLELVAPATAVAAAAGGASLTQTYNPPEGTPTFKEASAIVLIVARNQADLERFRSDKRWSVPDSDGARAWTDDYANVLGALIGRFRHPR
jgi:hypothetical protein